MCAHFRKHKHAKINVKSRRLDVMMTACLEIGYHDDAETYTFSI